MKLIYEFAGPHDTPVPVIAQGRAAGGNFSAEMGKTAGEVSASSGS